MIITLSDINSTYVLCTGYGNIAPKTAVGRVMTIIYATFGIPLTLLTISQVGKYMAGAFRLVYSLTAGARSCCRDNDQQPSTVTKHDVTCQTTDDDNQLSDSDDQRCSSPTDHDCLQRVTDTVDLNVMKGMYALY